MFLLPQSRMRPVNLQGLHQAPTKLAGVNPGPQKGGKKLFRNIVRHKTLGNKPSTRFASIDLIP